MKLGIVLTSIAISFSTIYWALPASGSELAVHQDANMTDFVEIMVCEEADDNICGGTGGTCTTKGVFRGKYTSTPGTMCWYFTGTRPPYADPRYQPQSSRLLFCNEADGQGDCHFADECKLLDDNSCDAGGTQSMTLLPPQTLLPPRNSKDKDVVHRQVGLDEN